MSCEQPLLNRPTWCRKQQRELIRELVKRTNNIGFENVTISQYALQNTLYSPEGDIWLEIAVPLLNSDLRIQEELVADMLGNYSEGGRSSSVYITGFEIASLKDPLLAVENSTDITVGPTPAPSPAAKAILPPGFYLVRAAMTWVGLTKAKWHQIYEMPFREVVAATVNVKIEAVRIDSLTDQKIVSRRLQDEVLGTNLVIAYSVVVMDDKAASDVESWVQSLSSGSTELVSFVSSFRSAVLEQHGLSKAARTEVATILTVRNVKSVVYLGTDRGPSHRISNAEALAIIIAALVALALTYVTTLFVQTKTRVGLPAASACARSPVQMKAVEQQLGITTN